MSKLMKSQKCTVTVKYGKQKVHVDAAVLQSTLSTIISYIMTEILQPMEVG